MESIKEIFNLIIYLDKYLDKTIEYFGFWIYIILFLVIFSETGLILTPFLPGDSLIFLIGSLIAIEKLSIIAIPIIWVAAILGDFINYYIGKFFGNYLLKKNTLIFFRKRNVEKTHIFYKKYGGKTIILGRFIPIIRTFAPFIAGIVKMKFDKFVFYNIFGATLWILLVSVLGYFFGNISIIKNNFSLVMLIIIIISLIPAAISWFLEKNNIKR